jgi:hypothetical protein
MPCLPRKSQKTRFTYNHLSHSGYLHHSLFYNHAFMPEPHFKSTHLTRFTNETNGAQLLNISKLSPWSSCTASVSPMAPSGEVGRIYESIRYSMA